MKHKALAFTAALAAIALTASVRAQGGKPAAKPAAAKGAFPILICDFAHVIENCEEAKDIEEAFRKERKTTEDRLKAEAQKLQVKIQEIQKKTKLSERDQNTYDALKKAIEDKGKLDAEMAYRNVTDQDFLQRRMQELLRGARTHAENLMIARGAHLVIATKVGAVKLENQQDMQDELLRRRVICHVKEVNLTLDVMKLMNDDYAKRKKRKKK